MKAELKKGHHLLSSSSTLKNKRRMKGRSSGTSFAGGSRSGSVSGGSMSTSMSSGMESVEGSEKLFLLEEMEKRSLRRALIEERSRFCLFVNFLRPVIQEELAMINEIHYLEEIMDNLSQLTTDPYILPPSSELVISDHLKLSSSSNNSNDIYANYKSWSQMNVNEGETSPPNSGFGSRKNSMCSISSFASNSNSDGRSDSPSSVIYASTGGHRRSQTRATSAPRCHSLSARGFDEDRSEIYREGHHRDSYSGHYRNPSVTNGTIIPIGVPTVPPQTPSNKTSPQEVISNQSMNYRPSRNSYSTNSSPTIHNKQPDFRQMGQQPSNLTRSSISVIDSNQYCDRGQYDASRGHSGYLDTRSTKYANSGSGDWTSSPGNDTAYSEGSITPTNPERSVSPVAGNYQQQQYSNPDGHYNEYCRQDTQRLISSSSSSSVSSASQAAGHPQSGQTYGQRQPVIVPTLPARNSNHGNSGEPIYAPGTMRRDKPPPLPPVRRTSAISDPNAITLGTLRSTGCSTYEEVKRKSTVNLSNYEDPIYCNLDSSEIGSKISDRSSNPSKQESSVSSSHGKVGSYPTDPDRITAILQKHHRPTPGTSTTNSGINTLASILCNPESRSSDTSSGDGSLPHPPQSSSSFITGSGPGHGPHRLNSVHKDFMQSLNDKLSIPVSQRMSPKLTKRRSMSVGEHEWDSDSGIVTLERDRDSVGDRSNPNSATSSISSNSNPLQQSLLRLMSSSMSTSSTSSSRPSSATSFSHRAVTSMSSSTGETYTAFSITSGNNGSAVPTSATPCHPLAVKSTSSTSSVNPGNNGTNQSRNQVDPTTEIAKAAADIAKRRLVKAAVVTSEGGHQSTPPPMTSTPVSHPSGSHPQDTYSATPVRVEYSPTHQPSNMTPSIINSQVNESGKSYRPLPVPPPNKRPIDGTSSVVVINASSRQQQFAATHHPSLDIRIPSDASIHNNHGQASVHPTSNGSIVSMKRGSLPAVIHRQSAGQVLSEAIGSFENAISARVNNWLSNASSRSGSVDLTSNLATNLSNCKETLMDQIKKGIQLKKVPDTSTD